MRKKIFSILLSLCMMLTMMPAMSMTAFAADRHDLEIYKGDSLATEGEDYVWDSIQLQIKKDGLTVTGTSTNEYIYIDPAATSLTIKNLSLNLNRNYCLYGNTLTLTLEGNNELTTSANYGQAILFNVGEITGEGNLTAKSTKEGPGLSGVGLTISASGNLVFDGYEDAGIDLGGKLTVEDSVTSLLLYGTYYAAVWGSNYGITVGESLEVTASDTYNTAKENITASTTLDIDESNEYFKVGENIAKSVLIKGTSKWSKLAKAMSGESDQGVGGLFTVAKDSPTAGTNTITLLSDITAGDTDTALEVPSGKEIVFDLNGHVVDRALTSSSDGGSVIVTNGKLTINDSASSDSHSGKYADMPKGGVITGGNTTSYGGGIILNNYSTVIMNGGTLTDCTALRAGGVYIGGTGASFTMNKGAAIKNCHATAVDGGGGIRMNNLMADCTIVDATITGNTDIRWYDSSKIGDDINLQGGNLTITGYCTIGALSTSGKYYTNNAKTKITFDNQGGTGGLTEIDPQNYNSSLPNVEVPTREGYEFQGYYDASAGGTQYIKNNGRYALYWDKIVASATLYAHWEPKTYHIYLYNSDSYYNPDKDISIKYDENMPTIVPPTKSGYTFNGYWDETSGDGGERVFIASGDPTFEKFKLTRDLYLKACWENTEHVDDHENDGGISGLNVEIYRNKSKYHLQNYYTRTATDKISHDLYYDIDVTSSDSDSVSFYVKPMHQAYEHGKATGNETVFTDAKNDVTMLIYLPNSMRDADRIQVKHIKDDGTVYYKDEQVRFGEYIKFENANGFDKFVLSTKKFEEPMFAGKSLLLGGDIGVNFYMDIPDDATNGQMVFKVSGKDGYTISADGVYVPEKKLYKFTCNLNSLKMADKITAEYKYNGYSTSEEYSIAEYLKQEEEEGSGLMKTLAAKMYAYGFYAQEYLEQVHNETVKFGDGDDKYKKMSTPSGTPDISIDLDKYSIDVSGDSSDISGEPEISLTLDSQVGLKLYLPLSSDSDYASNIPNVTVDGEELDSSNISFAENKGINFMIISINNIPTSMLGHTYEVVVDGNYTLKSSALTYANALLKNGDNDKAKKLGAALYEYYEAAMNYAGLDVE